MEPFVPKWISACFNDTWRDQALSDVLVLGAEINGKANLIVTVIADKQKQVKAGDLIKAISPKINGGGGGRPNLAGRW